MVSQRTNVKPKLDLLSPAPTPTPGIKIFIVESQRIFYIEEKLKCKILHFLKPAPPCARNQGTLVLPCVMQGRCAYDTLQVVPAFKD